MPLLKNPLNYYYDFSVGWEGEKKNDTNTRALTLSALRYWNNAHGWQYFGGLRARYDSFTQAYITDKTFLLYPTVGFTRTRLRGGSFATWGDVQKITFDLSNRTWLSESSFIKVQASSAWIRTYAENHRIVARAEVGYLHTKDIEKFRPHFVSLLVAIAVYAVTAIKKLRLKIKTENWLVAHDYLRVL